MPADLPADQPANQQFAPTLPQLRQYSLTENNRRVHSPQHGEKRATQISTLSPAQRRFLLAGERRTEAGNASNERQTRSRTVVECDERIASRTNIKSQSRSRLFNRSRSKNGEADLASRDGRDGDSWNSINAGTVRARFSQQGLRVDSQQTTRPNNGRRFARHCSCERKLRRSLFAPTSQSSSRKQLLIAAGLEGNSVARFRGSPRSLPQASFSQSVLQ
jgi:hypothetical protein